MTTTAAQSEDSRTFFQARLRLMYGVGLAISGGFLVGGLVRGALAGSAVDELATPSRLFHLVATVALLGLWALLALWRLSPAALDVADAGGVTFLLLLLACNAGLFELRTVSVFDLALGTGVALVLRSILLPSTGARTLAIAHLYSTPVRPSERIGRTLPADLEGMLLRGLAKAPADRPASAASFRAALLACDVPTWSDDDARAWWQTHGPRLRRPRRESRELGRAATVSVVLEQRS